MRDRSVAELAAVAKRRRAMVYAAVEAFLKGEVDHLSLERTKQGKILIKKHPEVKVEIVR